MYSVPQARDDWAKEVTVTEDDLEQTFGKPWQKEFTTREACKKYKAHVVHIRYRIKRKIYNAIMQSK